MVTVTFHFFYFPVYTLSDPGSTSSLVTTLVSSKFYLLPEILHEPFLVSNPIGDNIRAERVYRDCPITVLDRVTYANLIENKMLSKGNLYHLVRVNDLEHEVLSIDSMPILNEFQYVFPKYLPGIPPECEIDFGVDRS